MSEAQGEKTLYQVLDVPSEATPDEIKKAHRKMMRAFHPDVYAGSREEAEGISARINRAYATLSDAQERERYDALLRGEVPESGPTSADDSEEQPYEDTWGAEAEWEEVVDEEVVEDDVPPPTDPTPTPEPVQDEPPQDTSWQSAAAATTKDQVHLATPLSGLRNPLLAALAGTVVGVLIGTVTDPLGGQPGAVVAAGLGALGLILGAVAAVFLKKKGEEPSLVPRPLLTILLIVILTIAGAPLLMGLTAISAGLISVISALAGGYILTRALMVRSALEKIVKADALRKNNTFGSLPGGVGPDLLNSTLSALYAVPSARVMRNPDNDGLFSHAITNGRRVAFVKAITGFSGLYRWSGPSLLRERSGLAGQVIPEEVLRATYREFASKFANTLPHDVEAGAWIFIYTQDGDRIVYPGGNSEGNPQVSSPDVGLEQVGRFLIDGQAERPTVDQDTFIKAFMALLD